MIRQITRNEAERLIAGLSVISTDIRQSPGNLSVKFTRSDKSALLVIYNLRRHKKSYFILSPGALPHGSIQSFPSTG